MNTVVFPEYVETFVADVSGFLEHFACGLQPQDNAELASNEAREWRVTDTQLPTFLMVHRTSWSREDEIGHYRARIRTELPDEFRQFWTPDMNVENHFASLGAIVRRDDVVQVVSQVLLEPNQCPTIAGLLACALVHSADSILISVKRMLAPEAPPAVQTMSAWSDLDIEQLRYDWAHIWGGGARRHGWSLALGPEAWLDLEAVNNHPYFGGGLLVRMSMPGDALGKGDDALAANYMNNATYVFDDVPMLGAWTHDKGRPVFVTFLPNLTKPLQDLGNLMVEWSLRRSRSVAAILKLACDAPAVTPAPVGED